jgi:hypothetical protein
VATSELKIILSATDKASPSIKGLEASLGNLVKGISAIYLLTKAFEVLQSSINAAAKEEQQLRTLQSVIENQGEKWSDLSENVSDYITTLERSTMFTDDQLIPSMKQLINSGMSAREAMNALATATDLATAKGIDLETSANLIGKAYMGNTEALKRYGIQADDFNGVMGEIQNKFGGTATKEMDTYNGQLQIMEDYFSSIAKMLGNVFTPILKDAMKLINAFFAYLLPTLDQALTKQGELLTQQNNYVKELESQQTRLLEQGRTAEAAYQKLQLDAVKKQRDDVKAVYEQMAADRDKAKLGATPYTPEDSTKQKAEDEKDVIDWLETQARKAAEGAKLTEAMWNEINQLTMSGYDYEIQLIDTKAQKMIDAGQSEVLVAQWVAEQKKQLVQEEIQSDTDLLDSELWLTSQIEEAGKTLRANEVEAEKVKNDELLQLAGTSSQAITALGVATNSATLKGMGIVISGVQNAINAVNAMMMASGPVGFILGLLGFVTGVANTVSSLNQLAELENQNASLLETGNTGITTITNPTTTTIKSSDSVSTNSGVSSVERASSPTYYNISNTYNLNAGVVLGDEFNISEAFKRLMKKYDEQSALTMAGA